MSNAPSEWLELTLGEVADWGSGGTPTAGRADYYGGDIPWAVIGDLDDGPLRTTSNTITGKGLAESSAKIVPEGSVLIAMYGSIGKLGLPTGVLATNQAIAFAVPKAGVLDRGYLFWYLMYQRDALAQAGKGVAQKNISQTILKAWPITLPPLDEQRRIVAILEDHLSRLEEGSAGIQRVMRLSVRYRDSTLRAIYDEDAAVWGVCRLNDLMEKQSDGRWFQQGWSPRCASNPVVEMNDWGVLKTTAIQHGSFDHAENKRLLTGTEPREDLEVKPGDFLITRKGPRVRCGVAAYVGATRPNLMFPDTVYRFRVDESRVLHGYLEGFLRSPDAVRQIDRLKTGISESGLNLTHDRLLGLAVPATPLTEQSKALTVIESMSLGLARIVESSDWAMSASTTLRRALLQAAFSGQLTKESSGV